MTRQASQARSPQIGGWTERLACVTLAGAVGEHHRNSPARTPSRRARPSHAGARSAPEERHLQERFSQDPHRVPRLAKPLPSGGGLEPECRP